MFYTIMLISNQYHCSKLIIYKKFNNSDCKIILYISYILMFQCFNINIDLPHHHCWLPKSSYYTNQGSQFLKIHQNHLPHNLFPQQLLYSHKLALINMHHNEGSNEQIILQSNQQCNHLHHVEDNK